MPFNKSFNESLYREYDDSGVPFQWSDYSLALYDAWRNTTDNLIVNACPGSGKTTNIKYIVSNLCSPKDETIYLAFNRAIVDEAKGKLPRHTAIMTLNGLGHRAVTAEYGKVQVDGSKVYKLTRKIVKQGGLESKADYDERVENIRKAVGLLKVNIDITNSTDFESLCDTYDVDLYPGCYEDCLKVLDASDLDTRVIDYDDQLRFPILYDLHMPSYDNVLCDEVQDFNKLQALLVQKLNGRYGFVGDNHQAIYGFRGAMPDSMNEIQKMFNCTSLPLKLTYRCPKLVVKEAYQIYPDIETLDTARNGVVEYNSKNATPQNYTMSDLVLCRLNAPLLAYAYQLLRMSIPCNVKGRDIGQGLIKLIDKQGVSTVIQLIDSIEQWRQAETYKAEVRGNKAKIQRVNDKADSVRVFTDKCSMTAPIEAVKLKVNLLFANTHGVTLSTVHKAKGLEADAVYILHTDLMPLQYAMKAWEKEQEMNIKYVAVTRAKNKLVYM